MGAVQTGPHRKLNRAFLTAVGGGRQVRPKRLAARGGPHPKGRNGVEDVSRANVAAHRSEPSRKHRPPPARSGLKKNAIAARDDRRCSAMMISGRRWSQAAAAISVVYMDVRDAKRCSYSDDDLGDFLQWRSIDQNGCSRLYCRATASACQSTSYQVMTAVWVHQKGHEKRTGEREEKRDARSKRWTSG